MISHHYSPTSLLCLPILNPPEKQLKKKAQHWTLKLKRKSKNVGNITSIIGYYPRNGYIGDTELAINTRY